MVLVTGSIAFDYIMDFPGIFTDHINPAVVHKINVSFVVDNLKKGFGGTGGNIIYTLSLLRVPSLIMGAVGDDFKDYADFLEKNNINLSNIKIIPGEFTSQAYVMTDQKDNQISALYHGAMKQNHTLKVADINPKPEIMLITPAGVKAMASYVGECKKLRIPYMYDPGQQITAATNEELLDGISGAKIFISNDYEYEMIKRRLNFSDMDFLKYSEIVIRTKGAEGSTVQTVNDKIDVPSAKPTSVVDPTGGGDAYRAGFIAGFMDNKDLKVCAQMGSVAACYTVEKYGTTTHHFTIDEFMKRYEQNYG